MLDAVTAQTFEPFVSELFTIRAADGEIEAVLADVERSGPAPAPGVREPFSLTFRGPAAPALQQGLHEIEHPQVAAMAVFLVPIRSDAGGAAYQAVFS